MAVSGTYQKAVQGLVTGLICAGVTSLLFMSGMLEPWELKLFDMRFRALPASPGTVASGDIVLVTLDQGSLEQCLERRGYRWPWPREFYGKIVDFLAGAGARAVIFDMYFTEPDIERHELPSRMSDSAFARSLKRYGRAYHGYMLLSKGLLPPALDREKVLLKQLDAYDGRVADDYELRDYSAVDFPLVELANAARAVGFLNMAPDPDSITRRAMLLATYNGIPAVGIGLTAYWDLADRPQVTVDDGVLAVGDAVIPIDGNGRAYLWWYRPREDAENAFVRYPAYSVLNSAVQQELGVETDLPASVFRDKVVLIGSTAHGLYDIKATPLSENTPGVEVQATLLSNIIKNDFVQRTSRVFVLCTVLLACLLAAVATRMLRSVTGGFTAVLALAVLWFAGREFLSRYHIFVDVFPVMLGVSLSFIGMMTFNYFHERKHSRLVRGIFEHYLDRSVVRSLIADPERVALGGEERVCTVIFSDVANFTSISETLDAKQVVEFMNIYLNAMTEIIIEEGGFVDKFVGDEIVAIFGAPNDLPDHALCACRAVVKMQKKVADLQPLFRKIGCTREIFARSGLNTGEMIVGNMGSETRMNYTAMGDAMNLGARLEGTNKIYGTRVAVSDSTAGAAADGMVFRELDTVRVKGKSTGIRIYELVCGKEDLGDQQRSIIEQFNRALEFYRSCRWGEALRLFEENAGKGDGPSEVFAERCREYSQDPPEEGWDGIYVMKVK